LKNKNRPNPINARPATPPTTPPTIAPTGVFPEESLSLVEAPDVSVDDAVVDDEIVENVVLVICVRVDVDRVDVDRADVDRADELIGPIDALLQKSLLPGPPSMHPFVQKLITVISPLYPPSQ
jgi:hypothetical protein